MKPIIKYLGGKSKLLGELYLQSPKKYSNYIEPFVGGGALFFNLYKNNSIINDNNKELINFYTEVRNNPLELLNAVKNTNISEKIYYSIRAWDRESDWVSKKSTLQRATRFLYLNYTSFNGVYRENSSGEVNVSYGKYATVSWPNESRLLQASNLLRKTTLLNIDFYKTLEYVDKNSFVYLDPPCIPYSETTSFTNYASKGFEEYDQIRLVKYCDELTKIGAKFLLSNSDTPLTRRLYKDYNINTLRVYHSVGALAKSRKNKGEVLVRNYTGNCMGLFL